MPRALKKPWLEAYLDYVAETESPLRYQLWSGISAISATLKRRVFIDRVHYKLFPQQYIILVGPPGIGKGTAIHPAVNLVKQADTANIIADRVTAEKVVERLKVGFNNVVATVQGAQMSVEHSATIVVPELPVFLNASQWTLEFMCEMWDRNEWEYDTKGKGTFKLQNLCVGLFGGCVPDFIRKLNKTDATAAVSGGFTSRCVFVYETKKSKRIPFPAKQSTGQLEADLVADLQDMSQLSGEFGFSPDAKTLYEHYYNNLHYNEFESDVLIGFKERISAHIFKTAMALALSEGNSLVIEVRHLKKAMELIHKVRDELDVTFRGVGESPLAVAQDRIMRYIEFRGIVSRTQMLKDNARHITDEDLSRVLAVLEQIDFVFRRDEGKKILYVHNQPASTVTVNTPTQTTSFAKGAGTP